jgi:nuclear migration protein JNM1
LLRLRQLQLDLFSLETELSDPANLYDEREEGQLDPGELMKGLVEVKTRIEKLNAARERHTRLVQGVIKEPEKKGPSEPAPAPESKDGQDAVAPALGSARDMAEIDRRVGELEKIVGGSSASLDEVRGTAVPHPFVFRAD